MNPLNDPWNEPVGAIAVFLISGSEGIRQDVFFFGDSPEVDHNDGKDDHDRSGQATKRQRQPGKTQQRSRIGRMAHHAVRSMPDQSMSGLDSQVHGEISL